jgi:phenylacetate-CoA ligase
LLKEITGRITDFLKLNNIIIGSPVLTILMGKFDMEQYQIVQDGPSSITIRIVRGETYNEIENEDYIRRSLYSHVGKINITFDYLESIPTADGDKHKFIIRNLEK